MPRSADRDVRGQLLSAALVALAAAPGAQEPTPPTPPAGLTDPDPAVRRDALRALGERGAAARDDAWAIALRLGDGQEPVRHAALTALLAVRPDLLPARAPLIVAVARLPRGVDEWIVDVCFETTATAEQVDAWTDDLAAQSAARRREALARLAGLPSWPAANVDVVLRLATDADPGVRAVAAAALGGLEHEGDVGEELRRLTLDVEADVRAAAARSLANSAARAASRDTLLRLLQDPAADVRTHAIEGLTAGEREGDDEPHPRVGSVLTTTLRDRDPGVRRAALVGLARLGARGERTVAGIVGRLDDGDPVVVAAALEALAQLRPMTAAGFGRAFELTGDAALAGTAARAAFRIAPTDRDRGRAALRLLELIAAAHGGDEETPPPPSQPLLDLLDEITGAK